MSQVLRLILGKGGASAPEALPIAFSEPAASQAAEKLVSAVILSEALECGSLLPLSSPRACSRGLQPGASLPASKLARAKATASCRTPKRAVVALSACPDEFFRSL
ncbi:MAG: hypothetical protein ACLQVM_04635 [Terriglobia bacterium]